MINAPLIFKVNNYVRGLPDSDWDFTELSDCPSCWIGNMKNIIKNINFCDTYEKFRIPQSVFTHMFGDTDTKTMKVYNSLRADIKKTQVCNLVERYTKYKLRQEHKWKQYENRIFGIEVTEKRGIHI